MSRVLVARDTLLVSRVLVSRDTSLVSRLAALLDLTYVTLSPLYNIQYTIQQTHTSRTVTSAVALSSQTVAVVAVVSLLNS